MRKIITFIPILLLTALILIGAGCGDGDATIKIPASDVSGEDISDVSRYPGSVRVYYAPMPGIPNYMTAIYVTSASIETVSDFYETQLPANGWESELSAEMMEEFGLTYMYVGQTLMKGGREIFVLVQDSSDYSGYTEINIAFRE